MRSIIGITAALLLAVFAMAFLYFSRLTVDSRSNERMLSFIPEDASIVLQFSNEKSLYEIFRDYPVFDAIIGNTKKAQLSWLNTQMNGNAELYAAAEGQTVFMSFHPAGDSISYLWLMPFKDPVTMADLNTIFKSQAISLNKAGSVDIAELQTGSSSGTFYLNVSGGIAKGSFSRELLIRSVSDSSQKISEEFAGEINSSLQKNNSAVATVFISHGGPGFLKPFFKQNPSGNFGLFNSFNAFSSLNMNYKSDALMFNGNTRITERHDGYLNLFLQQQPVQNTLKKVLPYNVSNSICYGLSDPALFQSGLRKLLSKRKELADIETEISRMTAETGVNPERDIKKLWGNEFSNIQLSTYENLAIIRVSNGTQLDFFLEPLSSEYSGPVRKMNYNDLFYYYFGDPLKKYTAPFYAVTDNMIILSNSAVTVQRVLSDYNSDRLIYNNQMFTRFDQLVADQSNISFLLHLGNSRSLMGSLLSKSYIPLLRDKQYGFEDFYSLSYQLISNQDHFFTNFYLGLKTPLAEEPVSNVYTSDTNAVN